MKTFLLATAAVTLAGTAAWAVDDDNRHPGVRVANDHAMTWTQGGTVIEIRGEDGERTIHMQGSGADSRLTINGQEVQIHGNHVVIDGQEVEADGATTIIVDGDEIRVLNGGDRDRFDSQFVMHMAERAENAARMAGDMDQFRFEFDSEGMEHDVMASLEAALEGLDHDVLIESDSRDWGAMTEAERETARASMENAREEIRQAMEAMRGEMREAALEGRDESRRASVEMRHVAREAARAGRDEARAARDEARVQRDSARGEREAARVERHHVRVERDAVRVARNEARVERHHSMSQDPSMDNGRHDEQDIRVESSDDGRRQIWVNGEEQTGDDLVSWLNQLEADRLAGGRTGEGRRQERRIVRLNREDGSASEVDLTGRRVIVLRSDDADNDRRVFEFEFETDGADGEK
ncbi:hypothetical protein [uncultured Maricaulis sp.]|uniref:hypothetical protein n=1 Tax=uncultured Maricaulis sp. TaxID=174710 RepID=UPI0030D7AB72|tara:strand:- start:72 stop:1301 length:1230 start_codon:yes stop_codon:yes gene_type:complete